MSMASTVRLFGFISLTPMVWIFFGAQTALLLVALRLCLVPIKTARRGQRLILANALAIPLTFVISALSYAAGMLQTFNTIDNPEVLPGDKAAVLADGISSTIDLMWHWIPFAVILSGLLVAQIARHREAVQSRTLR